MDWKSIEDIIVYIFKINFAWLKFFFRIFEKLEITIAFNPNIFTLCENSKIFSNFFQETLANRVWSFPFKH